MKSVNDKILVSCDMKQKDFMEIGGITLKIATQFQTNFREKSPVIAISQQNKGEIVKGDILLCHHNHFHEPSPYFVQDDLYSIPFNHTIFSVIDKGGNARPVCGNLLVDKIDVETLLPVPVDQRKQHINRYLISNSGRTSFKKGQIILTRPHSGYDIVFVFNNIENRITKVNSEMVCGYI